MVPALLLLVFVTLQRLAELAWNRGNEARLRAAGAVEAGGAHYPVMVALHGGWLAALWVFGWDRQLIWGWVAAYVMLQFGRAWVLATLGRRWTTRVFVVPGETLVRRGPYRFVSHPNYVVVALEIFVLPLAFGLRGVALAFGVANLALLAWRIRVENQALSAAVRT
ncbi:isoprenylcysteine carboxyl methyltransferase family protein [Caulobacter sp. S45]|uniref:isoprenylcysteine carboxyl methyltransferase family protein n=1 Tax=Caulobacter sp. S45 TaxID=1641861 RepID=UPI0015767546|nr:isoprenylcysteine carboxylmethyltransferase family protein [Caulobacter sp. S45]